MSTTNADKTYQQVARQVVFEGCKLAGKKRNVPHGTEDENLSDSSLYEDTFERELENNHADGYHDDQLEDFLMQEDLYGKKEIRKRYEHEALLDHAMYTDCDDDLERVLTNGNGMLHPQDIQRRDRLLFNRFLRFLRLKKSRGVDNFYDAAEEVVGAYESTTPDSGVHENLQNMDPEQRAKLEEEWRTELAKTEEEIQTLRQVLGSLLRRSHELKRKLGVTVWKEFRDDMEQGLKNVKESTAFKSANEKFSDFHQAVASAPLYQKTNTAIKTASEKTSVALGTVSSSITKKLGDVKNSTAFRSFEERVGSVYTNVRTKMTGSRSNSMQNFEEALESVEDRKLDGATPVTTPTIPEEKPITLQGENSPSLQVLGRNVTKTIGDFKNSKVFRSFEGTLENVYAGVLTLASADTSRANDSLDIFRDDDISTSDEIIPIITTLKLSDEDIK
uniref:Uncharacterized protein n=1 Tax=Strigamia maritima TaxID=126957 RepID=T1JNS5_STRMM